MPLTRLRFPPKLKILGRKATDQQLWCLGCDVRFEECSLGELGWSFHRRPDQVSGCSRLTGFLPGGGHASIWGFGFIASHATHGGIWLGRYEFRPEWMNRFTPSAPVFERKSLPASSQPRTQQEAAHALFLIAELALRMAGHEERVLSQCGDAYRSRCVREWKFRRKAISPSELPNTWRQIAKGVLELRKDPLIEPVGEESDA